jgi:arylsulfatase A-like enzyme
VQDDNDITSQDVTGIGLEWLRQKGAVHDGVPWLLWLHYFDPHAPYLLHPGISTGFGTDSDADRYDGEIAYTDRHVGRLLEELAASPLSANTIVVIVADHGEEFGEHGNFGHGYALYEECVRVPLIVHAPGIAPRRVSDPVPTIDLLPTLLELCRVEARDDVEGRTILPLLRGETLPAQESLSEVRWQSGQDLRSLRSGAWKRIEGRVAGNPFEQLFDLGEDPGELHDISAKESARAAALGARAGERVRAAQALAGEHHQIGTTGPSPFEQKRLESTGYTGTGEGGVPQKPK